MPSVPLQWEYLSFRDFEPVVLYAWLKARQDVFVLEQECLYPDIDGLDTHCHHLLGWVPEHKERTLVAGSRIVPPQMKFPGPSIGRIMTVMEHRGKSYGRDLLHESISRTLEAYPNQTIYLEAQLYLEHFYKEFGFETISEPYDEDGIMHVVMTGKPDNLVTNNS